MPPSGLGGIEDAIKGHNIEIVAKKEDGTDKAKARSNVEDVINAYGDLNLVCGLWSYNGPAIAKALWNQRAKRAKSRRPCSMKNRARWTASSPAPSQVTCVQKPFMFGYLSAKWMTEMAKNGDSASNCPEGGVVDTGVDLIDSSSVEAFENQSGGR